MREVLAHRTGLLNPALIQHRHAVADLLDDLHFMRNDDNRNVLRPVDRLQQRENRLGRHGVERARRLVAEDDLRVVGKHARNCHALLLTARELRGIGVRLVGNADELQNLHRALLCVLAAHADNLQREADVSEDRALHEKVEVLEDHADLLPAAADFRLAERHHVLVVDVDLAGGRAFEQIQAPYQRALARPGEADYAEYLPRPYGKVYIPEGGHSVRLQAEGLCKAPYGYHFTCFHLFLQSEVLH